MTLALALLTGAAVCVTMVSCDDDDVTPSGGDTHEYVDLGLPSGTLWATCNIGATSPEEFGGYFAWGETSMKESYMWDNYMWCNGSETTLTKYCNDSDFGYNGFTDEEELTELLPENDAATANWGSKWRTPSKEQWNELSAKCTWTGTDVKGYLVTGPNGGSIFLPAAGYEFSDGSEDDGLHFVGEYGFYISRTLANAPDGAWYVCFYSPENLLGMDGGGRAGGYSVRPVRNQ